MNMNTISQELRQVLARSIEQAGPREIAALREQLDSLTAHYVPAADHAAVIRERDDLLAALRWMLDAHDKTCQGEHCQWVGIDQARAAIAKAEGK